MYVYYLQVFIPIHEYCLWIQSWKAFYVHFTYIYEQIILLLATEELTISYVHAKVGTQGIIFFWLLVLQHSYNIHPVVMYCIHEGFLWLLKPKTTNKNSPIPEIPLRFVRCGAVYEVPNGHSSPVVLLMYCSLPLMQYALLYNEYKNIRISSCGNKIRWERINIQK